MSIDLETPVPAPEEWQYELERTGFVRRILRARKWYKVDWWFIVVSAVMVATFMVLAAIPQVFAPHDPLVQVGPRFLAPGEVPDREILITPPGSTVTAIVDFAGGERPSVGVVTGTPSSEAARDEAERINQELGLTGNDRIRPRMERFETIEELFAALEAGELDAAVVSGVTAREITEDYPGVTLGGAVAMGEDAGEQSFTLGTNQIGQDVMSRLIWGTRISLIIGFSAALFSLLLGVPLGLFAGFTGGKIDRGLTLLMDSLYAFPGLILAIAITAVLGPSIFNIIVAIAVLYIPTYYRIVRGQTLSVKESLYVEAARSIGARSLEILRRYIYPNVIPSVAIIFSVNVADAILTGAGLSFLGLGLPPTVADWGIDLARGQEFINRAWWLITFPGLAVMLVVLAFTMMGEGLMEIFNPKLRER
jgi:peptide/nickel transport system permease protein